MKTLGEKDIKIPKDFVLIKANSKKHLTKSFFGKDGQEIKFDLSSDYTRMEEEFIPDDDSLITYDGIVKATPIALTKNEINIEVEKGDHVYFNHFCTDPSNLVEFKGEECYWFSYVKDYVSYVTSNLYCKIVEGEIVMLGDWNLIEIEKVKENEYSSSIIVPNVSKVEKENVGYMKCVSPNLQESISPGDMVFVDPDTIYTIYIEGKSYYIVSDRDVLAKMV
ncbi:co-chaperone GroES [bacterium]|nr:co-chaperone GroES [bacterium]